MAPNVIFVPTGKSRDNVYYLCIAANIEFIEQSINKIKMLSYSLHQLVQDKFYSEFTFKEQIILGKMFKIEIACDA